LSDRAVDSVGPSAGTRSAPTLRHRGRPSRLPGNVAPHAGRVRPPSRRSLRSTKPLLRLSSVLLPKPRSTALTQQPIEDVTSTPHCLRVLTRGRGETWSLPPKTLPHRPINRALDQGLARGFGCSRPPSHSLRPTSPMRLWSRATRACQELEYRPPGTTSETAGQEGSVSPARAVDPSTCRNRAAASRARASSRSARSSRPAWCCSSILVEVWLSRNATRTGFAPASSAKVPDGSPQAPRSLRSLGGPSCNDNAV
jgi:hypothetical protein